MDQITKACSYKTLLEFSKFKHSQQKLTKFYGVSGQLVFTKSSGKDSPVTFFSKDIILQSAKKIQQQQTKLKKSKKKKHNNSKAATVAFMNFEFWESLKLNVFRC